MLTAVAALALLHGLTAIDAFERLTTAPSPSPARPTLAAPYTLLPYEFDALVAPESPESLVVGDVNGDSRDDIVAIVRPTLGAIELRTRLQQPDGSMGSPTRVPCGVARTSWPPMRIADVDEDGDADVLLVNDVGVSLHHRTPAGPAPGELVFAGEVNTLAAGFIDGDARLDVAVTIPVRDRM